MLSLSMISLKLTRKLPSIIFPYWENHFWTGSLRNLANRIYLCPHQEDQTLNRLKPAAFLKFHQIFVLTSRMCFSICPTKTANVINANVNANVIKNLSFSSISIEAFSSGLERNCTFALTTFNRVCINVRKPGILVHVCTLQFTGSYSGSTKYSLNQMNILFVTKYRFKSKSNNLYQG